MVCLVQQLPLVGDGSKLPCLGGDSCDLATPFQGNDIHKLLFYRSNVTGVQISSQDCIELHISFQWLIKKNWS